MNFNEAEGERYRQNEEMMTCPFNKSHRVQPARFALHVVRCEKKHPHIKLEKCLYNSTHYFKKSKMAAHLLECPDKKKNL
uniref:Gametocyte-specific factor 1 n=1 Tax=Macrobrachium nipponense TaxID=159736 RepID=A0A165R8E8_MACNP|nr:gametocyte-specific factor 1 [Macrobrachium nipponense]